MSDIKVKILNGRNHSDELFESKVVNTINNDFKGYNINLNYSTSIDPQNGRVIQNVMIIGKPKKEK